ncbi:hypothetical protein Slin15195_G123090 [Septoria linicola]|uniref:Uncharacterized protein n=1 Tax=Septoria linicola TaxID=215465 RepID=A0A9Q9B684_9PEZI|nr:hypothetical protein Slin15195_G123090 [Septoria linicola]
MLFGQISSRSIVATLLALSPLLPTAFADTLPGCQNPGAHTCTAIVYAGTFAFPVGGGTSSSSSAAIGDGGCNKIDTSGSLDPQSPGFKGEFQTVYGTTVEVTASFVGTGDIEGVQVKYGDQTINQDQCRSGDYGFDPATSYVQCNFAC